MLSYLLYSTLTLMGSGQVSCGYVIDYRGVSTSERLTIEGLVGAELSKLVGRGFSAFHPGKNRGTARATIFIKHRKDGQWAISGEFEPLSWDLVPSTAVQLITDQCSTGRRAFQKGWSAAVGAIQAAEQERDEAIAERDEVRAELAQVNEQLEAVEGENEALEATRRELLVTLADAQGRADAAEETIEKKERINDDLESSHTDFQTSQAALEASQADLATSQADFEASPTQASEERSTRDSVDSRTITMHAVGLSLDLIGTTTLAIAAINGAYCGDRWFHDNYTPCQSTSWRSVEDSLNMGIAGAVVLGVGVALHVTAFSYTVNVRRKAANQRVTWTGTTLRF